jgi:hypothetical protein
MTAQKLEQDRIELFAQKMMGLIDGGTSKSGDYLTT